MLETQKAAPGLVRERLATPHNLCGRFPTLALPRSGSWGIVSGLPQEGHPQRHHCRKIYPSGSGRARDGARGLTFWIPAFAGMTVVHDADCRELIQDRPGLRRSRRRRKSRGGSAPGDIPAIATLVRSFPRRRESMENAPPPATGPPSRHFAYLSRSEAPKHAPDREDAVSCGSLSMPTLLPFCCFPRSVQALRRTTTHVKRPPRPCQ